jgi:hypothetical protein
MSKLALDMSLSFGRSASRFTPSRLFSAGEQGAWFDPSDFSTMFQDSAGSTPVTAVEQPVGRINDKSGRGNNATQGTAAARPTLRARYNLLTYSEQFDNAAWADGTPNIPTVTANSTVAPNGTTTADTLTAATGGTNCVSRIAATVAGAVQYTFSVFLKQGTTASSRLLVRDVTNGTNFIQATMTWSAGTPTVTAVSGSWSAVSVGNDWWQLFGTATAGAGTTISLTAGIFPDNASGTGSLIVWGADLRATNDGVGLPAYQRIAAATNYDTAGFPPYLAFDGTDDSLATSAIDFSATDEMTVVAGVRKLSDAAAGIIAELSVNGTSNNGTFFLQAPRTAAATNWRMHNRGTANSEAVATPYVSPITFVAAGAAKISTDSVAVRHNGTQVATDATDQGTGNYGNYALNIGSRNASSTFFNGRLYGLIIRGKTTDATQLTQVENWMNSKTRAF